MHVPPFGDSSILSRVDWSAVTKVVIREQANREKFTPSISVFRWWARRPHSLIGAIIDAAKQDSATPLFISDPFSGGGTVAIEAARRGLPMHAQDLYPWPIYGLQTCLSMTTLEEFDRASETLCDRLASLAAKYRRSDGNTLSHIMRVRIGTCPECQEDIHLFPEHLVSLTHRDRNKARAFYGCSGCGHIHIGDPAVPPTHCPACRCASPPGTVRNERRCPHCKHRNVPLAFQKGQARWTVAVVQQVEQQSTNTFRAVMRLPDPHDPIQDEPAGNSFSLNVSIGPGQETRYLLNAGFTCWGELYTSRQAEVITQALEIVRDLDVSEGCRDRLATAVIGLGEMPAYLCRWDRLYQKVVEGNANHHFDHTTFVVETNLLSPVGRGTLKRRLISARKALIWRLETIKSKTTIEAVKDHVPKSAQVQLGVGSSAVQLLPNGKVMLALTDPPYFDDVQYGELARLFHFWLNLYCPLAPFDEAQEAVPNRSRGKIRPVTTTVRQLLLAYGRRDARFMSRDGLSLLSTTGNLPRGTPWLALFMMLVITSERWQ